MPPQRLFEAPTIAQLAVAVESDVIAANARQETQEEERLEQLLRLVEGLSDEEAAAMLADPERLVKERAANG
jgi:DNA-directed RNA polymerase specialized sigma24 family protein